MAVGFAAATGAAMLNALLNQTNWTAPTAVHMQLHIGDPGAAGTANVAGNTTRKDVTASFPTATTGSCVNDVAITWTNVSNSEDYTHFSLWSASTAGTFYASGTITANAVTAGDTFTVAIGAATVTVNTAA